MWEKLKQTQITNGSNASSATRELNYYEIAKVIVGMLSIPEPWVLSLDRTSVAVWTNHIQHSDFGHCSCAEWHFQCCGGCKGKKGNSNTNERIELLEEITTLFPERKIAYLTADREFLGHDWFGYLLKHPTLPFRIRIRASDCLSDGRQRLKASVAKAHLKPQQTQVLPKRRRLWGYWLYVAALRLEDNELLVERHSQFSRNCDRGLRWQMGH